MSIQLSFQQVLALAHQHHQAGQLDQAEALYQKLLAAQPGQPDVLHLLGIVHLQRQQVPAAIDWIQQAVAKAPERSDFRNNLGLALQSLNQLDGAIAQFAAALAVQPDYFEAINNLGNALRLAGRTSEALAQYRLAVRMAPQRGEVLYHLASMLEDLNCLSEAGEYFRQAAKLMPLNPAVWADLAHNTQRRGQPLEALAYFQKAIALDPEDDVLYSAYLFCLLLLPKPDLEQRIAAYQTWGQRLSSRTVAYQEWSPPQPGQRIRVGYVCSNFRDHSSAKLILPLYRERDQQVFELFSYSAVRVQDAQTTEFRDLSDHWREIQDLTDAQACEQIRQDGIQILVDLNSPTLGHRLGVFAAKPAPVQVTGLVFGASSGVPAIDYRLTDEWITPASHAVWHPESLYYIPLALCFQPPNQAPAAGPAPVILNGYLTFGCGNRLFKLNPEVLALWCEVLLVCPDSRLRIKTPELDDPALCQELWDLFGRAGIAASRIDLLGSSNHAEHLAYYDSLDLALDPFPYDGGISTCEAIWMGLPVLSLVLEYGQRGAVTLLPQVGLQDWLANSTAEYLSKAVALAKDPSPIISLRAQLRERLSESLICDQVAYLRSVEAAYLDMLQRWHRQQDATLTNRLP